uniref:ACB domain-containing protein n=1 Tax=Periophthalmus magnuspinnatus TaxID=409849 RepID=A0A3B4B7Z3_9GOBI
GSNEAFLKAAEEVKVLKQTPNRQEISSLYGLYKQATVGDIDIDAPGMFSFVAKEKWNAWNAKKGRRILLKNKHSCYLHY